MERVLKGGFEPGREITVEFAPTYVRQTLESRIRSGLRRESLPKGKALLFLQRDGDVLRPVPGGVKWVVRDVVYCYGQFDQNPGGLFLTKMAPESMTLPKGAAYDGEVRDATAAVEVFREVKKLTQPGIHLTEIRLEIPHLSWKKDSSGGSLPGAI